jgi:SAM-dependent methyltransferase
MWAVYRPLPAIPPGPVLPLKEYCDADMVGSAGRDVMAEGSISSSLRRFSEMTVQEKTEALDQTKLLSMQGRVFADLSSAAGFACAYIGDRLGLYKAMANSGPVNSAELAALTSTSERYLREWLINQAAGKYVTYDEATEKYFLPREHAEVLANEHSPLFAAGGFQILMAMMQSAPKIVECIRTGEGLSWGDHHPDLFEGTERFFRPGYNGYLVQEWLPAAPGLVERLSSGAVVADVGCGHGVTTLLMARHFPSSKFFGFDNHLGSITAANAAAMKEGLSDRVKFVHASSSEIPDQQFDVLCFFDCLHDMGDPVAACRRAKEVLKEDGALFIVEPQAGSKVSENFNEVGRVYSSASVMCCTPNALAAGGTALGTVATDDVLAGVLNEAGFTIFKRVVSTPLNRVFVARVR